MEENVGVSGSSSFNGDGNRYKDFEIHVPETPTVSESSKSRNTTD
jgi:hypothetical protein